LPTEKAADGHYDDYADPDDFDEPHWDSEYEGDDQQGHNWGGDEVGAEGDGGHNDPDAQDLYDPVGSTTWEEIVKSMLFVVAGFSSFAVIFVAYGGCKKARRNFQIQLDIDEPLIGGTELR
jgi:hypothetical protein